MKISIDNPAILVYSHPVSLITSTHGDKRSVFSVSWLSPVSVNPTQVMLSVAKNRFSLELIRASNQFAINIPTVDQLKEVIYCGNVSGRDKDKFAEKNYKITISEKGNIILDDCVAFLECKVVHIFEVSDHFLVVGEVENCGVEEEIFDSELKVLKLEKTGTKLLTFIGKGKYGSIQQL